MMFRLAVAAVAVLGCLVHASDVQTYQANVEKAPGSQEPKGDTQMCESYKGCEDCIQNTACGWCTDSATCIKGDCTEPRCGQPKPPNCELYWKVLIPCGQKAVVPDICKIITVDHQPVTPPDNTTMLIQQEAGLAKAALQNHHSGPPARDAPG